MYVRAYISVEKKSVANDLALVPQCQPTINGQNIIMEVVILNVFISRFLSYISATRISFEVAVRESAFWKPCWS